MLAEGQSTHENQIVNLYLGFLTVNCTEENQIVFLFLCLLKKQTNKKKLLLLSAETIFDPCYM